MLRSEKNDTGTTSFISKKHKSEETVHQRAEKVQMSYRRFETRGFIVQTKGFQNEEGKKHLNATQNYDPTCCLHSA